MYRLSSTAVYREIADAIEDHRHTCGEHLRDEELVMLDAMVSHYDCKAAQEIPEIRMICWFGLMMDGYFGGCHWLPDREPRWGRRR